MVAAACLSALVIVASVEGSDALATTALALAIITFVVQLIVYVAQAEQTRRENELAQRLHADLRASLADISARAHGTESTMETINDKLLDRALQRAGSSKLEDFPPGFTRDVAKNLAELMEESADEPPPTEPEVQTEFPTKDWGPDEDARVRRMLTQWPRDDEEISEIKTSLEGVPLLGHVVMSRMAADELEYRDQTTPLAPSVPAPEFPSAEPLYERGLIENYEKKAYGTKLVHLTEKGRRVARAFVAEGDPPEQIADFIQEIRAAVAQSEAEDDQDEDDVDIDSPT